MLMSLKLLGELFSTHSEVKGRNPGDIAVSCTGCGNVGGLTEICVSSVTCPDSVAVVLCARADTDRIPVPAGRTVARTIMTLVL